MLKPKAKKTLSVFLLCFSIAATEPAWNYRQASLAAPASGYEITRNTPVSYTHLTLPTILLV